MKSVLTGVLCLGVGVLIAVPAVAQIDHGFVIHMAPADFLECGSLNEAAFSVCADVNASGNQNERQFAWVLIYGYDKTVDVNDPEKTWPTDESEVPDPIGGCRFGIEYDETVIVEAWKLCAAFEIKQDDDPEFQDPDRYSWPESGAGNAISWARGGHVSSSSGYFVPVGYFEIAQGSTGRMSIINDPRLDLHGNEQFQVASGRVDAQVKFDLGPASQSSADIGGTDPNNDRKACEVNTPVIKTSWGKIKSMY